VRNNVFKYILLVCHNTAKVTVIVYSKKKSLFNELILILSFCSCFFFLIEKEARKQGRTIPSRISAFFGKPSYLNFVIPIFTPEEYSITKKKKTNKKGSGGANYYEKVHNKCT
jgi:hypothetical protein